MGSAVRNVHKIMSLSVVRLATKHYFGNDYQGKERYLAQGCLIIIILTLSKINLKSGETKYR